MAAATAANYEYITHFDSKANQLKSYFIKRLRDHFPQPPRANNNAGASWEIWRLKSIQIYVCVCVYIQHKSDKDQPEAEMEDAGPPDGTPKIHTKIFTRTLLKSKPAKGNASNTSINT